MDIYTIIYGHNVSIGNGSQYNYYLRGTVRGQSIFEVTGTNDPVAADAIRIKRENELLQRSVFGPAATVTFAEAAVSYLDDGGGESRLLGKWDEEAGQWTLLIGHFGNTPIARIGQAEIDAAAAGLYPNTKATTRERQVYIPMSAVLRHAARKGWCATPMLQHPRVKQPVTKWSTPERLDKLFPHCTPKLRHLVVFLTYTGARISEALPVDWDGDISLEQRSVILRRTKNGKPRTVHLPDPLLSELMAVPEAERKGKLFNWKARSAVYGPLRRACKRAGVEYLPPHQQGRHTYATWLRTYAGLDMVGLKEAGGWESLSSVERYAHVVPNEAAKAADRLPTVQKASTPSASAKKKNKSKR
jgi:integrase